MTEREVNSNDKWDTRSQTVFFALAWVLHASVFTWLLGNSQDVMKAGIPLFRRTLEHWPLSKRGLAPHQSRPHEIEKEGQFITLFTIHQFFHISRSKSLPVNRADIRYQVLCYLPCHPQRIKVLSDHSDLLSPASMTDNAKGRPN